MSAFCRSLLESRDPFDGRNLLLLACGAGSTQLVDVLLQHAERSNGSLIDAHARSHIGETALHLAAASGHFEICKKLLMCTSLQLKGPSAESLHHVTPLQLAGTAMHWQFALQLAAYVCGPLASEQGATIAVAIQDGLGRRFNAPDNAGKLRPNSHVASVADVMGHDFLGSSFTVLPSQLSRIRQDVASSAHVIVLLSNALLCEPTALVALVAAYDLGKSIVGVVSSA
jgi:hypothetical protein